MRGTPAAVLDNDELMRVFLPTLRADFAAHGTYACTAEPPLDCPVLALGGVQDPLAPYADLDAWRQHTRSSFELRMLNGDHFFLQSQRPLVLQYLARFLEPAPPA
jgi:medium-chain acyl-[acyl-carrier-protein] hydrolase